MKKRGLLLVLLFFVSLGLFAESSEENKGNKDSKVSNGIEVESKKDLQKSGLIKPKVNFSFYNNVQLASTNEKLAKNALSNFGAMTYIENRATLGMAFKVNNFYTVKPWAIERFETHLSYAKSVPTGDPDGITFRGRNRIFLGLTNIFTVPKVMKISLDLEYKIENDLRPKITASNPNSVSHRLSPSFKFNGKYNFGFNWMFMFRNSVILDARSTYPLRGLQFTSMANLSYNVLNEVKSVDNKKYGLDIFANNFFLGNLFKKPSTNDYKNFELYDKFFIGFRGRVKGFKPELATAVIVNSLKGKPVDDIYAGLKMGLSYKYKKVSFGLSYIGAKKANDSNWYSLGSASVKFGL